MVRRVLLRACAFALLLCLAKPGLAQLNLPPKPEPREWLTPTEQQFFEAMPSMVIVGGKARSSAGDPEAVAQIGQSAEGTFGESVRQYKAIWDDTGRITSKWERLGQITEIASQKMSAAMLLGLFSDDDPFDIALDSLRAISAETTEAWLLQREILETQMVSEAELQTLGLAWMEHFASRVVDDPNEELILRAVRRKNGIGLQVKFRHDVEHALVFIKMSYPPTDGTWTAVNAGVGIALQPAIGTSAYEAARLAAAQELSAWAPSIRFCCIPAAKELQDVNIPLLSDQACARLTKIEVRVICSFKDSGFVEVEGLESVKKAALRAQRALRRVPAVRGRQNPPAATEISEEKMAALEARNNVCLQILVALHRMRRSFELQPADSRAATLAAEDYSSDDLVSILMKSLRNRIY